MLRGWTALVVISASLVSPAGGLARADDQARPPASAPSRADIAAAATRFRAGQELMEKRDYAGAISEFEQAYQHDPRNEHLYNLGVAHHLNGDRDQAIDYYRRYLAAEPRGKLAADARRFLDKLEAEAAAEQAERARRDETARLEREQAEALRAAEQACAEAGAARAETEAARAETEAARAEAKAAQERADKAELAARTAPVVPPVALAAPAPSARPVTAADGIRADANSGRSTIMPTALTEPAGTWSLANYDLVVVAGSYAFTDKLTMSAGVVVPATDTVPLSGVLNAKRQVYGSGRVWFAAQSSLGEYQRKQTGVTDSAIVLNAGGVLTLCIDHACHSQLSGYTGAGLAQTHSRTSALYLAAASLGLSITDHLSLVFETDTAAFSSEVLGGSDGAMVAGSLRFVSRYIGIDLGLAIGNATTGSFAFPIIGLTVRRYKE